MCEYVREIVCERECELREIVFVCVCECVSACFQDFISLIMEQMCSFRIKEMIE